MLLITIVLLLSNLENKKASRRGYWVTMECPKVRCYLSDNIPRLMKCLNPLTCSVIQSFSPNWVCLQALICSSLRKLREHIPPTPMIFQLTKSIVSHHEVWKNLSLKGFHGRWGQFLGGMFIEGLFCMGDW